MAPLFRGSSSSLENLLAQLDHWNPGQRIKACQKLAQLGGSAARSGDEKSHRLAEAAAEALLGACRDSNPGVAANAVRGLVRLGDDRAVEPLGERLGEPGLGPLEQRMLVGSLEALGSGTAAMGLAKLLDHPHLNVRRLAAASLGELAERLALTEGPLPSAALEGLVKGLQDPEGVVRAAAAQALGRTDGEAASESLLEALGDEDGSVRLVAARSLARLAIGKAVAPLAELLDRETEPRLLTGVAEALLALGPEGRKGVAARLEGLVAGTGPVEPERARPLVVDQLARLLKEPVTEADSGEEQTESGLAGARSGPEDPEDRKEAR